MAEKPDRNRKQTPSVFDKYRLPLGITEGVEIELAGTGAVFRVSLPAAMNEDFQMKLLADLNLRENSMNEDGTLAISAAELQASRRAAFFKHCILEARGLPDGMDHTTFFREYPLAAREIMREADRLAAQSDMEVEAALGKSGTSQDGPRSGPEKRSNTNSSKRRGSTSGRGSRTLAH